MVLFILFGMKGIINMIPDEHSIKFNQLAEELGLDYRMGSLIVSLKGNRGTVSIATSFECSHLKGNYEKYDKEKHTIVFKD